MPVYEAAPEGSVSSAVIVIQEAFGVTDHIRDLADRFAAEGYLAVAPAIFHRTGSPEMDYEGDFARIAPHFAALDDDRILMDVDATLGHVLASGVAADHTAIVGYCFGGRVTFLVATTRRLGAAVGYYGGGIVTGRGPTYPSLIERVGQLATPWLGLFGDQDQSIPAEDVETLRARLASDAPAGVDAEVVRYAEAGHGFFNDARPQHFHQASAADAWPRTLDWFRTHL
jgi:carboxymethylenebutenolidase